MPADLKDQLAFLFAHKENALLRFYKYNKYTKHNSIPTKHLKIMFLIKFIRNLITKTDTANATAIPRTRASSSALVNSNPNFNSLKALAPSIVGTARKK